MDIESVQNIVNKLEVAIEDDINKGRFDSALNLISQCADILSKTNITYRDDTLERDIKNIAGKLKKNKIYSCSDKIIFYDGFGLDNRGLIHAYLSALCPNFEVVYITYKDKEKLIPNINKLIHENSCQIDFIKRTNKSKIDQINQLIGLIEKYTPKSFFYYSVPNDVVGTTVMSYFEKEIKRYQINLTDHAFWLGSGCIDKCIEFRDYGASISTKYRSIRRDQIIIIPFYPYVDS